MSTNTSMERLFWHQLPQDVKYELEKVRIGRPKWTDNDGPKTIVEWAIAAYREHLQDEFDRISYDIEKNPPKDLDNKNVSPEDALIAAYKQGACDVGDAVHDHLA